MPKMKTHRGAAKRFKITGSGKLMRQKANLRHILEKKPAKRKRRLKRRLRGRQGRRRPRQAHARPVGRPSRTTSVAPPRSAEADPRSPL